MAAGQSTVKWQRQNTAAQNVRGNKYSNIDQLCQEIVMGLEPTEFKTGLSAVLDHSFIGAK